MDYWSLKLNRVVEKTVVLNLLRPTVWKQEQVDELFSKYKEALSFVVDIKSRKDRNASVNIALRAALQRPSWGQISERNLSVMAGVLVHAGGA